LAQKKIYDYKVEPVKNKIISALKRRRLESTVTDLVAATGLPTYQVQETMKVVSNEYRGHMKVTESGEILYYFPYGMRSQLKGFGPAFRRTIRAAWSTTLKALAFLFKIWIMVMLVGYFVLFVALLVLAFLASIAGSFASNSSGSSSRRSRDGGLGGGMGFFLASQVIRWFIDIWFFSTIVRDAQGGRARRARRPLHRSVFSYVFGVGDPNPGWDEAEKKTVIRYIQGNKGIITIEEFMTLTGRDTDSAQHLLNEYLLEFQGEPEVTREGSLYYRFNDLLHSKDLPKEPVTRSTSKKSLYPFSSNKPTTNKWITFFNVVNLLFGGYFLYYSLVVVVPQKGDGFAYLYQITSFLASRFLGLDPTAVIPIALGIIPLAFSLLFFLVPLVRRAREKAKNLEIKRSNFLKRLFDRILQNPLLVDPRKIQPSGADETPDRWEIFRDQAAKRFAAAKGADVEEVDGAFVYRISELDREQRDVAALRNSVDIASFNIGKTIYDSGE